jgi:hypothetical protein
MKSLPAFAILIGLAGSIGAGGAEPVRLGVYLQAPASTSAEVLESLRLEVERVVSRPGIQVHWRNQTDGNEAFHRVLVVRLRGSCTTELPAVLRRPAALGSTHVNNGRVQPFIDISCDQVTSALSRNWDWPTPRIPGDLYGRALARVVSHEIVHALTESVDHDECGLMKPFFDRHDLLARNLSLAPPSLARLDRALSLGIRGAD